MNTQDQNIPFELESLSMAHAYQKWIFQSVEPYLGNSILEIGAGIGNLSQWLPVKDRLILSESSPALLEKLNLKIKNVFKDNLQKVEIYPLHVEGQWEQDLCKKNIDTILSFNVMEHIQDDFLAFKKFRKILEADTKKYSPKRVISFVPAHSWAYGSLDKKFDHFRRYDRSDFIKIHQEIFPDYNLICNSFNFVGIFPWLLTGKILKSEKLNPKSIMLFNTMVPLLKPLDSLLINKLRVSIGQSMVCIFESKLGQ